MKKTYSVRYVHKIAPSPNDVGADVELSTLDLHNHKELGAAAASSTTASKATAGPWSCSRTCRA